jgi:hypothetical protein
LKKGLTSFSKLPKEEFFMKNKKVLAIALAAAMAITAIIPSVANAAHTETPTATGKVAVKSEKAGEFKLQTTTDGTMLVTSGSYGSGSITDTITFTTTTSSVNSMDVHAFDTDGKEVEIVATSDDADVEMKDNLDISAAGKTTTCTVKIEKNEDTESREVVVKFFCGNESDGDQIAEIIYTQAKGSSSSGGGGGSSSGTGTTKTEKLADGSTKTTNVVKTATGTITTTTVTKPDGSKTIVKRVENKDGSGSVTETTITKDGTEKTVMIVTDKTGAVVEVSTSVSNAKGVSAKMTYSVSGSKITLAKVETKGKTALSIPATVKCDGKTFKVTKIGAAALKGNKEIKKVTVGKNVTAIGKNAFKGDSKLKTVVLKGKVSSVGKNAFKSVYKKATFKIAKANFKTVKKAIKKSGVAKTVKYKKA